MSVVKQKLVDELHRSARRNFVRQRTQMRGIRDTLQADLVEMIPYASQNQGMKYILTVINIFSKKAYAKPLKSKSGKDVKEALEDIIQSLGHPIKKIHTDRGKEFYNADVRAMLARYNIYLYSTFSSMKAAICERFNRTLKSKMWKQFSFRSSFKWTDILPKLLAEYNNAKHSTIRMPPNDVNTRNEGQLMFTVYNYTRQQQPQLKKRRQRQPTTTKFKVGDSVRMSKYKHVFEKGYTPNWTTEIFTIRKVLSTNPTTYLLKDWLSKEIEGAVYTEELQMAKYPDIYLVEKILRRKDGKVYVKWLGFGSEFNQWIDEDDVS